MSYQITRLPEASRFRSSPRPTDSFLRFKGSTVPKGGWTQQTFQTAQGRKLIKDVLAVRKLALRENVTKLSKGLRAMFEEEVEAVLIEFGYRLQKSQQGKTIGSGLRTLVLNLQVPNGSEAMWEDALNAVFSQGNVKGRILKVFKPRYQSVIDSVLAKTKVLIPPPKQPPVQGVEPAPRGRIRPVTATDVSLTQAEQRRAVNRQVDQMADKVTGISETTKRRMRAIFRAKIASGATLGDVIETMKRAFPQIAENRIPTIVRTEMGRAANAAQIIAFQSSLSVTHCSVVGCQAVEDDSPTYRGFHTCNIRNVPVEDLHLVEFHINHTGSWVPTGFKNDDGTVPRLSLGNAAGIGQYDDPNALRHTDPVAAGLGAVARLNRHYPRG